MARFDINGLKTCARYSEVTGYLERFGVKNQVRPRKLSGDAMMQGLNIFLLAQDFAKKHIATS